MGYRILNTLPSKEQLFEFFSYDPESGFILWKKPHRRISVGSRAFCNSLPKGYLKGVFLGKSYYAHRISWKMASGRDPLGEIDHINGDKSDNRFSNLREVTHLENTRNTRLHRNNRHGVPGLTERKGRWSAIIGSGSDRRHLGTFETKEEAIAARRGAEAVLNYHPNHGRTK